MSRKSASLQLKVGEAGAQDAESTRDDQGMKASVTLAASMQ